MCVCVVIILGFQSHLLNLSKLQLNFVNSYNTYNTHSN